MSEENRLEVIAPDGWRKEYPLQKAVVFIGSDPDSDITLATGSEAEIEARHLQLIAVPEGGYRLVNLGSTEIEVGETGQVGPRVSTELAAGDQIKLGGFVLILHGGAGGQAGGPAKRSRNIGLELALSQTRLGPQETVEGTVTVHNLGDYAGAQFELDLEGFEADCYELEPGPLLSSGADKEVSLRLYHLGHKPLAGEVTLTIWASAPKAYPGEEVSLSRRVEVLPYYDYGLSLSAPAGGDAPARKPAEAQPPDADAKADADPAARPAKRPEPLPEPEQSPETADWWSPQPEEAQPRLAEPQQPKLPPQVESPEEPVRPRKSLEEVAQPPAEAESPATEATLVSPAGPRYPQPEARPVPPAEVSSEPQPDTGWWTRLLAVLPFAGSRSGPASSEEGAGVKEVSAPPAEPEQADDVAETLMARPEAAPLLPPPVPEEDSPVSIPEEAEPDPQPAPEEEAEAVEAVPEIEVKPEEAAPEETVEEDLPVVDQPETGEPLAEAEWLEAEAEKVSFEEEAAESEVEEEAPASPVVETEAEPADSLPSPTEAPEPAPAPDPETESWWTESPQPEPTGSTSKWWMPATGHGPARAEAAESGQAGEKEPGAPTDWWSAPEKEETADPQGRPVLKLKARPPEEPPERDTGPSTGTVEDWWAAPAEESSEPEASDRSSEKDDEA